MTFLHYVQFLLSIFCGEERCAFRVSLIDGMKALYKGFFFFFNPIFQFRRFVQTVTPFGVHIYLHCSVQRSL